MKTNRAVVLKVGGYEISTIAVDTTWNSELISSTIQASLNVSLKKEFGLLSRIDLRGVVTLDVAGESGELEKRFTGVVVEAEVNDDSYNLKCRDFNQIIDEVSTGGGFGAGMLLAEIIYYLLLETTPDSTLPENFKIDGNTSLADTSLLSLKRRFVFIAPLPCLELNCDEVKLARSSLYNVGSGDSADDRYIADLIKNQNDFDDWSTAKTRVRFYVQAHDFMEAFSQGRDRFRSMLDILSFGSNYSTPTYKVNDDARLYAYKRERTQLDVRDTPWAYVRETHERSRYWLRWYAPHRLSKPLAISRQDAVLDLFAAFQNIIEEDSERLTDRQRTFLNALHALRQARQDEDTTVSLSHVWRCVEYLASGGKSEPMFSKSDRNELVAAIERHFEDQDASGQDGSREKKKQRVIELLGSQLNSLALRTKWTLFCERHGVEYSTEEQNFLWKDLRGSRNDDQHGRATSVSRRDIERAAVMLEKALIAVSEHLV